jgi:hypothetical protein
VGSAEETRALVVRGDLPYDFIGTRAREAYNGSRPLTTSMFITEWTSYTQNALFVGGFVLFVGVLLPGAAMALWTFYECCYEEDEEEEQENRNLTWKAQVVVWSLAGAVVVVLVVLLIMVGILLGANSWMTQGVTRGSAIARHTIPQLAELKDSALQELEEILVDRYENLTDDLQTTILDEIPTNVQATVSDDHSSTAVSLSSDVKDFLSETPHLLSLADSVAGTLGTLHTLTSSLGHSLSSLLHSCTLLTEANNSSVSPSLLALCGNFTSDLPTLVPESRWNEVGGVSDTDDTPLLVHLQSLLRDDVFSEAPPPLPQELFHRYLQEMVLNLSTIIDSASETYFSSLGANLSEFTEEVAVFYNSSLPLHAQPKVELYLGPRHLENWEWFRSVLTGTFAILIFAGSVPLLVALGRGLYFVTATYRYSESSAYDHGAHQAGLVIKKVAFSLSVVCLLSASFTGVCLSVSGVMGKACGNHNNFSELLQNVVDNPSTWSGQDAPHYPLAAVLLNLSHYPLTVADTLDACRANVSLFRALHLGQRYDLEDRIWLSPSDRRTYREEMQKIHLYLHTASLVSPGVKGQLRVLDSAAAVPVDWVELVSLPHSSSLFQDDFVGFAELQIRLEGIRVSVRF